MLDRDPGEPVAIPLGDRIGDGNARILHRQPRDRLAQGDREELGIFGGIFRARGG